jgi:DNA-binding NarL/FixJ family response regulator
MVPEFRGFVTQRSSFDRPIRVVLADDHPIVLHGLAQLLAPRKDISVVATCSDGRSAVAAVIDLRPDVLVVDLRMEPFGGLDVLRALSTQASTCRSIILTAAVTDDEIVQAIRLGAMALIMKDESPDIVIECIHRIHRGEKWIERESVAGAFQRVMHRERHARESTAALTPREAEIVKMVALGLRNKVIAEKLTISEGTVKVHLHNVFEKYGLDGRLELALYAREKGLT